MRRNESPRLTRYLTEAGAFVAEPLVVVDAGARGGFESHWAHYGGQAILVGFEPEKVECERLNRGLGATGGRYYPVALGAARRRERFYVAAFPPSSGIYKANVGFWSRFPDIANLEVKAEAEIETEDLDGFLSRNGLRPPDFMKLDVEGAELLVLSGAERALRESVLGVSLEVLFADYRDGAPTFAQVDGHMRARGFRLFDIAVFRHARRVLNGQPTLSTTRGQAVAAQVLYLRDAVHELEVSPPTAIAHGWSDVRVLKCATLMEVFDMPDCAIELIRCASRKGLIRGWDARVLTGLLLPGMTGYGFARDSPRAKGFAASAFRSMPAPLREAMRRSLGSLRNALDRILSL